MDDERPNVHRYRFVQGVHSYSNFIPNNFKQLFDFGSTLTTKNDINPLLNALTEFGKACEEESHTTENAINLLLSADFSTSCIFLYTCETFVCYKMNEILRKDDPKIHTLTPFVHTLMDQLDMHPYHGTVYRGFKLTEEQLKNYVVEKTFFWPGFSSASKYFEKAAGFAECNVVFKIIIPPENKVTCGDIESLSRYPTEGEVLIKSYTFFRVISNETRTWENKIYQMPVIFVEASAKNISGVWECNDGGEYFVGQYGKKVFWLGRATAHSPWHFTHVAHGLINNDDVISATFGDLPIAKDRYSGEILVKISQDYSTMEKIGGAKIFGGGVWKRKSVQFHGKFPTNFPKYWGTNEITGFWSCSDGGNYYMSQFSSNLFWLGYDPKGGWCNVGVGKIDGKKISVDWGDILLGGDRLHGKLELELKGGVIVKNREKVFGVCAQTFLGNRWVKKD